MSESSGSSLQQQKYYSKEWEALELSRKPGRSGWRTSVPASDFLQFIEWLKEQKITGKALDLGCGGGRHSIALAKNDFSVDGLDFAPAAVKTAAKNAADAKAGERMQFRVGDVLDLPYDNHSFDIVNDDVCLHHIQPDYWPLYTKNIQRVIKPGGILRLKAFSKNCEYFRNNSSQNSQWVWLSGSGYTHFFSDQEIHQLFDKTFEILKLEEKAHAQAGDKKFFFVILRARTP